jgi:intergrase/recombinase
MITIKTKKVVKKGVALRKILEIKALAYEELPTEYFSSYPYCYKKSDGKELYINNAWNRSIFVNELYRESYIQELLKAIAECGARLKEINVKVKELEKTWVGEETFCF